MAVNLKLNEKGKIGLQGSQHQTFSHENVMG